MLRFRSVSKIYNDDTVAVDSVSLEVSKREFCVLLGPSGAGKTTFLRMVNGMVMPTEGEVTFDGKPINKKNLKSIRHRTGMIHQQLYLVQRLSVINNVLSGALPVVPTLRSLIRNFPLEFRRKACQLLEQVELEEKHIYRRVSSLSGGQQQRVAIARAFILDPDVVLADEPVASLDPVISRSILRLIKSASKKFGSTVLCSLHQVEFAMEIADRIVGFKKGKVVYDGTPEDLTVDILNTIYEGVQGTEPASMATESFKNLVLRHALTDPSVRVEVLVS